jgi:hypothetical protein
MIDLIERKLITIMMATTLSADGTSGIASVLIAFAYLLALRGLRLGLVLWA